MKMQFPYYDKKHLEAVIRKMVVDGQDPKLSAAFCYCFWTNSCLEYLGYLLEFVHFRIFCVIYFVKPKKAKKCRKMSWFNTQIQCYKFSILTKMESSSYPKWQSKWEKKAKLLFWPPTFFDKPNSFFLSFCCRLLPVKENFLTRQVFKVSIYCPFSYVYEKPLLWVFFNKTYFLQKCQFSFHPKFA